MLVVCLDLEGVLVPEIWIAFAERTGIAAFRRTTRDEPDYDKLMRFRIGLLHEHGLTLPDIQRVIGGMQPLPGAHAFLDDLRARYQVVILSDTFYEFADPLMQQLGRPTLFCHRLIADADGRIVDYKLRLPDQKRRAVEALRALNFRVLAAGDSYNDTAMLGAADAGFLIHPPDAVAQQFPQFAVTRSFDELKAALDAAAARLADLRPPRSPGSLPPEGAQSAWERPCAD
ncbi:MAG TPA: bifunctional phosphoserine phosphatase/homoserine phosphotransferase ThrH [Burkholderiaceae bacterium]|nr:bifunctional phosphoserine phosphatase/homoserine phosphotransferase ThrH [Burkholderiaceae bacterium]